MDGGEWLASHPRRFTRDKNPQYVLVKKPGGLQSRSGRGGEEEKDTIIAPAGN
jgi:hypothetical protein